MSNKQVKINWSVSPKEDGMLLRCFLREVKGLSKKTLADIKFKGGFIFLNGEEVTVRTTVCTDDEVEIHLPEEKKSESLKEEVIPFEILFEDDHMLVINKPPGMPTIPSRQHPSGTLANAVMGYYHKGNISSTFHAVNRLDRDTSGLLVVAKHGFAHDQLAKAQKAGKLKRFYRAIVEGCVQPSTGTIHAPIGRKPTSIIERMVTPNGQVAITHYKVIASNEHFSDVEVDLQTGRTHQIRVHFAHLHHPLVGDELYGGETALLNRQALHCARLELIHPFTGYKHVFVCPLPQDIKMVKEAACL
ncbi:RluA family pseudouridine synthase [Alkalihalophilus lindianensis]|uniref:Pseudouridine synthase n=2 Tax=Alkalihalophilus lindianensis TaxID=1630542 RepID=A0ABU3XB19_9BACI|nr:RluA family pseudouridine synthase [Alkalihalophilus lindianensis]MDV2685080.1 RluA family pseudouridine synthase [Alkalihalophilus lindianensis]